MSECVCVCVCERERVKKARLIFQSKFCITVLATSNNFSWCTKDCFIVSKSHGSQAHMANERNKIKCSVVAIHTNENKF